MAIQLLRTKLYIPPPRPELVARPHLIKRLDAAIGPRGSIIRKLTLISAPAGFGKTTLVSEWVHSSRAQRAEPLQVTWISLDEGDNDLTRFLTYFITALNGIEDTDVPFGKGTLSMLQSPQLPPIETILIPLINELTATSARIIFVLDDYYLIETQPIHDALIFLLAHLPSNLHLAVATRVDPPSL
jgi:LuxR family maltose regulon positive regulatory protein